MLARIRGGEGADHPRGRAEHAELAEVKISVS